MNIDNIIKEEFNRYEYLRWKRKNVTIRGIKDQTKGENDGGAMLGRGLYTAFLSNKELAKQYGDVHFVFGAIPKNPKVFNTLNEWEIWEYNSLIYPYLKKRNLKQDKREFFKRTNIEDEMMKMGYDGIIIKGREMVNYKPDMNEIKFFSNENQLIHYYEFITSYEN